jgi:flagellar hook-associated protein FlgK
LVTSTEISTLWYNPNHMAEKFDIEKFSQIVLDEFGRVNERLDQIGQNLDTQLLNLGSEIRSIHRELDTLTQAVGNMTGFSKEIDHLLQRVAAIEKHLGLTSSIKA